MIEHTASTPDSSTFRSKLRRWELSWYVKFDEKDEKLSSMVSRFANEARQYAEKSNGQSLKESVEYVVNNNSLRGFLSLRHWLIPTTYIISHDLADRFEGDVPALCLDRALMAHLIFEKLGQSGSRVVGFKSPETRVPSFGVSLDSEILTMEQGRWIPEEKFKRILRMNNTPDHLHNIFPVLSMRALVSEWLHKNIRQR